MSTPRSDHVDEGTSVRPAEEYADYRFFRFLTLGSSRLVLAGLFFVAWNLLFYRHWETLIFLLTTTAIALFVSLAAGMVAYMLYKRRGGRVEKTPPPFPH